MTSSDQISYADAARWMDELAAQVAALFGDLDRLAERRSFHPLDGSSVYMTSAQSIKAPEKWMRTWFGRGYGKVSDPKDKTETTSDLLIFEVWLAPSFGSEEATALGAILKLPTPLTRTDAYKQSWKMLGNYLKTKNSKTPRLTNGQRTSLTPEQLEDWNPNLAKGSATILAVDLTSLTDRQAVNTHLFEPLTAQSTP